MSATTPGQPCPNATRNGATEMLDCESVMRQLWDYLDGQLTPQSMTVIRRHLDECEHCRPQAAFRRTFDRVVAEAREEAGNTDALRARIVAALRAADGAAS